MGENQFRKPNYKIGNSPYHNKYNQANKPMYSRAGCTATDHTDII